MITLTDSAAVKVKELLAAEGAQDLALRVAVRPGGCSGFSYEMFFDGDIAADDEQATLRRRRRRQGRRRPGVGAAPRGCHARLQGRARPVRVRHHEPERLPHLRVRPELQLTATWSDASASSRPCLATRAVEYARPPRRVVVGDRTARARYEQPSSSQCTRRPAVNVVAGVVGVHLGVDEHVTCRRSRRAPRSDRLQPRRTDTRRAERRRADVVRHLLAGGERLGERDVVERAGSGLAGADRIDPRGVG